MDDDASAAAIVVVVVCDASRLLGGCGGALFFIGSAAEEEPDNLVSADPWHKKVKFNPFQGLPVSKYLSTILYRFSRGFVCLPIKKSQP